MDTLTLKDVTYDGRLDPKMRTAIYDQLRPLSYEFTFGRSYLLDAELGKGAWSLCWMIGGLLEPGEQGAGRGIILRNGAPYPRQQRENDAWIVRTSEFKGFWARHKTTRMHIQQGLKSNPAPYFRSEEEYVEHFHLSLARFDRPIRQLSHEGWRASCAIGVAHGKEVFCFPYLEYVRPYFIEDLYHSWLKEMIDLLRDSGALVLIPAIARKGAETLCDEIVPLETNEEILTLQHTITDDQWNAKEPGEYLCVWCTEERSADSRIAWGFLKNGLQVHGVCCIEKNTVAEYNSAQAQLQTEGWTIIGVGKGVTAQATMLRRPKL